MEGKLWKTKEKSVLTPSFPNPRILQIDQIHGMLDTPSQAVCSPNCFSFEKQRLLLTSLLFSV